MKAHQRNGCYAAAAAGNCERFQAGERSTGDLRLLPVSLVGSHQ